MRNRQAAALIAAGMMVLSACSTIGQAPTGPAGASTATGGGGASGGSSGTSAPNPNGAPGTITGSFKVHAQRHSEDPTVQGVIDDTLDAAVFVSLKRDTSAPGEAYVDAGSTYTVTQSIKTSRLLGDCTATSETTGDGAYAFTDQPTSTENSISATVDRASKTVLIMASFSWGTHVTANACDGRQPFGGENAATAACPFFGLTAALIEGAASDQVDTACQLSGGETYSGILTLTH